MSFVFEERPSDSPLVEKLWRTSSDARGTFTSIAASNWEMVVTRVQGKTSVTMRGPETKASPAEIPGGEAEYFGVVFRLGAFMPDFPALHLIDRNDATLPEAAANSFWLAGARWELPSFENADTFISRLTRQGLLVWDGLVEDVLRGQPQDLTARTLRRRFLRATGLTPGAIHQIERARFAIQLLQSGTSILDAVFEAGYYDQPHLTRALKHFAGQTPAQIVGASQAPLMSPAAPMSVLYNTRPDYGAIMAYVQPTIEGALT